jgi:hypothetical protein
MIVSILPVKPPLRRHRQKIKTAGKGEENRPKYAQTVDAHARGASSSPRCVTGKHAVKAWLHKKRAA